MFNKSDLSYISGLIPGTDPQKRKEADKIQAASSHEYYEPSEDELKTAAQLAQEGYLSSLKYMRIKNRNISEISRDNMAKLSSIVKVMQIDNITPVSHLGVILASVQSYLLILSNMSLSEENTRALVTAMRTRVGKVRLRDVTLDPELLSAYDGQGRCNRLNLSWLYMANDEYAARLKRWAADRGWVVTQDNIVSLEMVRR